MHTSRSSEVHYYPLRHNKPVLLHSHAAAPYVPRIKLHPTQGLDLTIYSSGPSCDDVVELVLTVDWWGSLGRLGTRYPTMLLSFCVTIVSLVLFHAWRPSERPQGVSESLEAFVSDAMPRLMGIAAVAALLPLGPEWYLGLSGELGLLASAWAMLFVGLASGLVCVSWWVLRALMWPLQFIATAVISRYACHRVWPLSQGTGTESPVRKPEDPGLRRSTVVSVGLVLLFIFLFVPWQVAFLGCWIIQLLHCAVHLRDARASSMTNIPVEAIPLRLRAGDDDGKGDGDLCELMGNGEVESSAIHDSSRSPAAHAVACRAAVHAFHQNTHILLLLTWLLPLTAPVLAVWVRTLLTAGYTTPFNGDHNVVKVAPILWLVDYLGRGRTLDTRYSAFLKKKKSVYSCVSVEAWGRCLPGGALSSLALYRCRWAVVGYTWRMMLRTLRSVSCSFGT